MIKLASTALKSGEIENNNCRVLVQFLEDRQEVSVEMENTHVQCVIKVLFSVIGAIFGVFNAIFV